jgi:hypothetical protein
MSISMSLSTRHGQWSSIVIFFHLNESKEKLCSMPCKNVENGQKNVLHCLYLRAHDFCVKLYMRSNILFQIEDFKSI